MPVDVHDQQLVKAERVGSQRAACPESTCSFSSAREVAAPDTLGREHNPSGQIHRSHVRRTRSWRSCGV